MRSVEVLYPEICNLYGDLGNIRYIKSSVPDTRIIETSLNQTPHFSKNEADIIYMGAMTESSQLLVINALKQYKERICELIKKGTHFLITGNAPEIFGKGIHDKNGEYIEGLGIFDFYTKRDMMKRINSLYLGKFDDIDVVGYKSQFSTSYYCDEKNTTSLFTTQRGIGFNKDTMLEGIKENNFWATYVIGPLLILNPLLTHRLLDEVGINNQPLSYEKECMEAYEQRLKEYSDPHTGIYY